MNDNSLFNEGSNDEEEEWMQGRRYSLQLNESKAYRRSKLKISAQPQLDSEEENEQPTELSRQNTM